MTGRTVLGIDAAWTATEPSGVALVRQTATGWRLVAVQPSYQHFIALAEGSPISSRAVGSIPDISALVEAAHKLGGRTLDLVAVDMPLARGPITERRVSDNAVSRVYGARKCGTHSPSAERPGWIAAALRDGFAAAGFALSTTTIQSPALIEVYPHPALVELAQSAERLPYKISRIGKYWPDCKAPERRGRLLAEWRKIVGMLDAQIGGVRDMLPEPSETARSYVLKSYEDCTDAVVCAWVGVCALEDSATAYGDDFSAIWIPSPPTRRREILTTDRLPDDILEAIKNAR